MIDFSKVLPPGITMDFILSRVDDGTIFTQYFGPFNFKKTYCSVFTRDKHPSTRFYIDKAGRIRYWDFRNTDNLNCFSFVQKMYGLTFPQALRKIAVDFGLVVSDEPVIVTQETLALGANLDRTEKPRSVIHVVPDKWQDKYLAYWRMYDVSKNELIDNGVYPVKQLYVDKREVNSKFVRYAYRLIYEDQEYFKIYSPLDPNMKWLGSVPIHVPFGLKSLPGRDKRIIITKSMKDMIVLKKLFSDVIATQNESEGALSDHLISQLHSSYDERVIFWDNDKTGVDNCTKFNDKGFGYFNIPRRYYDLYRIKDASDFVAYFGVEALRELLTQKYGSI